MAINEGLVMDPAATAGATIDLNPATPGLYVLEQFDPGLAPKKPDWLVGDADGAALLRPPYYDQAQGTAQVRITPAASGDMDGALAAVGALTQKMQECELADDGLPVLWTPAKATSGRTMYWQLAEFDGAPPIDPSGDLAGWFVQMPVVKLKFTRKSFLYAPEIGNVTDSFGANTISGYTFDLGGGTLAVSGGQLVPSSTAEKRLYANSGGYDGAGRYYDTQTTVKFTTGASAGGLFSQGVTFKRLDANNFLLAQHNESSNKVEIFKLDGGAFTSLAASTGTVALSTGTSYWIRGRIEGNLVTVELWTAAPTVTGSPALTVQATLAGGDATKFGHGVAGQSGLRINPIGTDWRYDDFTVEPNVWTSTTPLIVGTLPGLPGDAAPDTRLVITDGANQSRRVVEWATDQPATLAEAALPLMLDSDNLVTTAFSGAQATRGDGYNPDGAGSDVVRTTLPTSQVACCGTGDQSHVGTYRVKARVAQGSTGVAYVRLNWQENRGGFHANQWASTPVAGALCEVDLGLITVPRAVAGTTQQWSGRVEAFGSAAGTTLDIDYLELLPVGLTYGKARSPYQYVPGALSAYDDFTGAGSPLNGRTAAQGGAWATSGATTDFGVGHPATGEDTMARLTASDTTWRYAILGSTSYTDTEVGVAFRTDSVLTGVSYGVFARWIDASNFVVFFYSRTGVGLQIVKRVAGVDTAIASSPWYSAGGTPSVNVWYGLRLVCYADGAVIGQATDPSGAVIGTAYTVDSALATGGALASGKPGFGDSNANTSGFVPTRWYDHWYRATPATEPIALYAGRTLEARPTATLRQDSSGASMSYFSSRGGRLVIAPAGSAGRVSRVAAKAHRNDIDIAADANLGDRLRVQALVSPAYLHPH